MGRSELFPGGSGLVYSLTYRWAVDHWGSNPDPPSEEHSIPEFWRGDSSAKLTIIVFLNVNKIQF